MDSVYRYEITKNVLLTDPGLPIPQSEVRDENTGKWCYVFLCSTSDDIKKQFLTFWLCFQNHLFAALLCLQRLAFQQVTWCIQKLFSLCSFWPEYPTKVGLKLEWLFDEQCVHWYDTTVLLANGQLLRNQKVQLLARSAGFDNAGGKIELRWEGSSADRWLDQHRP